MQMIAEVQQVRVARDYRDKNGNNHKTIDVVLTDKTPVARVAGVPLVWTVEEGKDPASFLFASSLQVDNKINLAVDGLRAIGGEYRLSGKVEKPLK